MLAAAVIGSTLATIDESVVNIALPRIESELHTTLAAMQWVINAYTLCMSALLLVGGAAADRLGRRLMFMVGVGGFASASIVCGIAPGISVLVAARAVQGVGAALLIPCALALIGAAFDEKERGAAIGVWAGASAIAAGAAPLLGGWLVDHATWRAIFLINPLAALPTLWIAWRHVPESRDREATGGLDWRGALLAFIGLGGIVYGLISASSQGWSNVLVLGAVASGVLLLAVFVLAEHSSGSPMMPLELFRSRRFSGINALTLLLYGALGGAFFFLPFLLIQGRGYSATAAGAIYLPFTIVLGLLSRWSGGLVDRFGARAPLVAGPSLVALGFVLVGIGDGHYRITFAAMIVLGLGMALTAAPLTTVVVNCVPAHRTGVASGINNAVATVGGLMLIAVLGSLALGIFDRSLDRSLGAGGTSAAVREAVQAARGGFVIPPMPAGMTAGEEGQARSLIAGALVATLRLTMWVAAVLALLSAVTAALTAGSAGDSARKASASS
ncbi:MAG TPA: DHA2 family efflux MFS transporter permease subunit [Steroidobacteraceae bacterium]|nr:DHA2 family efflux MFS transporter permease subunit [Steroidobacteraceae bacterium]